MDKLLESLGKIDPVDKDELVKGVKRIEKLGK